MVKDIVSKRFRKIIDFFIIKLVPKYGLLKRTFQEWRDIIF